MAVFGKFQGMIMWLAEKLYIVTFCSKKPPKQTNKQTNSLQCTCFNSALFVDPNVYPKFREVVSNFKRYKYFMSCGYDLRDVVFRKEKVCKLSEHII